MSLYYTGDSGTPKPDAFIMRFDNQAWFLEAIYAALNTLALPENWEQAGDVTPEEAAALGGFAVQYFDPTVDMIGTVHPFFGDASKVPEGALICNGQMVETARYPLLAAVFGTNPDDDPEMQIPDLRGLFLVGANSSQTDGTNESRSIYTIQTVGGADTVTLTTDQMPTHTHTDTGHTHTVTHAAPNVTTIGVGVPEPTAVPAPGPSGLGFASLSNTGGSQAHENRPRYMALMYIIIAE